MKNLLRPALGLLLMMTLVTGGLYPYAVTGLAGVFFPDQAQGSLIRKGDVVVGSASIGQSFSGPAYFWGRPSATAPMPYHAASSSGSNWGPTNPQLMQQVKARIARLRDSHPNPAGSPIPADLVTASASGLDPHISTAAALYQVHRVAQARHLDAILVRSLVSQFTEKPQWGMFGEERVHVLKLNLALDGLNNN